MILIPRPKPRINNEKVGCWLGLSESMCQKNQNARKAEHAKNDFHGCSKLAADRQRNLSILYGNLSLCPLQLCANFFFQAEDGIRDLTVTGVQTCALPI